MRTTRWILIPSALLVASILVGCGDGGSDGYSATGASRVGDGIPSTAGERASLEFGSPDGCSADTTLVLFPEAGAVIQSVCGVDAQDAAGNPILTYKGIPYADTTAGDNRWVDPKPPREASVRAVEYGPQCAQGKPETLDPAQTSEDCLYLNVWTPKGAAGGKGRLPVIVFIHGGAFVVGSGGSAEADAPGKLNLYDGRQFLATAHALGKDAVFVTMNYRLGALGFLAGSGIGLDGNFGIKDQTRALEWVQRNIALFGGDPGQVMIFGESAGAQSTALHLTIEANGHQALFRKAALESNYGMSYMSVEEAQHRADAFAKATSCYGALDLLKCLRGLPLTTILAHQTKGAYSLENLKCDGMQAFLPWNPVIDHSFIVRNPIQGTITKPVVVGSNLSESIPFFASLTPDEAAAAYPILMDFLFGTDAAVKILARYALAYPREQPQQVFEQVVTDYMWTCFNRAFAQTARKTVLDNPVYRYHDLHHGSFSVWGSTGAVGAACSTSPNVCHADELPFVFGNATNSGFVAQTFTADEASMSSALRQYWVQFAAGAGPNGAAPIAAWPLDSSGKYLQFQAPASALTAQSGSDLANAAFCDFWDGIGYTTTQKTFSCGVN